MNSSLFKLNGRDFLDVVITSIFVAVVIAIGGLVQSPGFSIFTTDWSSILRTALNVSFVTLIGSLAKKFASDDKGRLMGKL